MSRKQLLALCACNALSYIGLAASVSLMPLYLERLGADPGVIGFFLAFIYLSMAVSTILAGHLSDLLKRRKMLLVVGGALVVPLTVLAGCTTAVLPLMLLMGGLYFMSGIVMAMVSTLAGLFSEPGERGRLFGAVNLSTNLGLTLGLLMSGPIVDRWGYPALFWIMAALYMLVPVMGGLFVRDREVNSVRAAGQPAGVRSILSNRTFLLLFIASILGQAANSLNFMTRPVLMDHLHFSLTEITTSGALGGLITLPLPLLIGHLSDRFGRKGLIVACFVGSLLGLAVLLASQTLWEFTVAMIFETVLGMSVVVGSALVTEMFPEKRLGTALALLNITPWVGIVLGLSAGGVAINTLSIQPALVLAMGVSTVALLLLLPMSVQSAVTPREPASATLTDEPAL